jgi:hypothetical protein
MALLEEASRLAINATLSVTIKNNVKEDPIGQPQIEITKLAPENALEYKSHWLYCRDYAWRI